MAGVEPGIWYSSKPGQQRAYTMCSFPEQSKWHPVILPKLYNSTNGKYKSEMESMESMRIWKGS